MWKNLVNEGDRGCGFAGYPPAELEAKVRCGMSRSRTLPSWVATDVVPVESLNGSPAQNTSLEFFAEQGLTPGMASRKVDAVFVNRTNH